MPGGFEVFPAVGCEVEFGEVFDLKYYDDCPVCDV